MELTHYTTPGLVKAPDASTVVPKQAASGKGAATPPVDYLNLANPVDASATEMPWSSRAEEPTFRNVMDAAVRENNMLAWAADILVRPEFDAVPGYVAADDKEALDGIPPEHQDKILGSVSPEEAQYWRGQAEQAMIDRETIEAAGNYGTAAVVTAALMDPISMVGGMGTVKAAAVAARLAKGSKAVGRAVGMTAGAAEGYAYGEIGKEAGKMDAEEQLIGTFLGMGAGTLIGHLAPAATRTPAGVDEVLDDAVEAAREFDDTLTKQAQELVDTPAPATMSSVKTDIPPAHPNVMYENAIAESTDIVPAGVKLTRRERKELAAAKARGKPVPDSIAAKITAAAPEPKSAGAAGNVGRTQYQATPDDFITSPTDRALDFATDVNEFEATFGAQVKQKLGNMLKLNQQKWLTSQARRFLTGENAAARYFSYHFLENASGSVNNDTAAMLKHTLNNKLDRHIRTVYDAMDQHTTALGKNDSFTARIGKHTSGEYKENFDRALRAELEGRRTASDLSQVYTSNAPQYIQDAADAWQKMADEAADLLGHYGLIDSAQALKKKRGYVPLKWNTSKIHQLAATPARLAKATNLLAKSYVKMGMDADIAERVAKRVFERALQPLAQIDANLEGLFDASATGQLRELLKDAGVDESAIGNLLSRIDSRFDEAGSAGFTKYRSTVDLNMADGDVTLLDLVDNDMTSIYRQYTGELSGRVAMASKGIRSEADWKAMTQVILDHEARLGNDTTELAAELAGLHDAFMSRPRGKGINRNAMRLMEVTRLSMLGKNGFSQLHEMGNIVGRYGVGATLKAIPAAMQMMKDARKGIRTPLMEDVESLIGAIYDDHLIHRPDVRLDRALTKDTRFMRGVDNALAKGQHYMGYLSGMHHITELQRRMAVTMEAGKLAKLAKAGDVPAELRPRMEAMGFDFSPGGNWARISAQLAKHAVVDGDLAKALGTQHWDRTASNEFATILQRSVGQTIQQNFIGETPSVLHSSTGALLTQFRAFPMVAREKQLQRNIQLRDMETVYSVMGALAVGTIVAPVRMALEGKHEDISFASVASSAISYMPMASVMPDVAGIGAAIGVLPDWAYHRNWAADKMEHPSLWDVVSPPSVMYLSRAGKAVSAIAQTASPWDEEYNVMPADVRAMQGTFLGNSLPVSLLFNEFIIPTVE